MPYTLLIKSSTLTTAPWEFWPSSAQIDTALQSINGVIGRPRIVRQPVGGRQVTYATILVSVADVAARTLTAIREQVFQRLQADAGLPSGYGTPAQRAELWSVETLPYTPEANGAEAWWRSGTASQTATRDTPPDAQMLPENPIGPDTTLARTDRSINALGRNLAGPGPSYLAFILKSEDRFIANAPTKETLDSIFNRVPKGPGVTWLGNATRVTRFGMGNGVAPAETYAVRVAHFPDTSRSATQAELIRSGLEDIIRGAESAYGWESTVPIVANLDPRFGRPSFWTSGQAGVSNTWRTTDPFGAEENPYGPNDPAMRPTTLAEWAGNTSSQATSGILWPLAIAAAVFGAIYFFGPVGRSLSTSYAEQIDAGTEDRRSRRKARRNPRRKARKSRSSR